MVNVTVIDSSNLLDACISQLKYLVKRRVVGIDVKLLDNHRGTCLCTLLLLCVGTRCLVIQMHRLGCVPKSLGEFLGDKTICFVGTELSARIIRGENRYLSSSLWKLTRGTAVGIGHMAARVLKDNSLEKCSLAELADKVELNFGNEIHEQVPWNLADIVHSIDEVKYAVYDVYRSFAIGNKLLGML
ncbi:hypothetical protein COLO4_12937 [Corchorus olitorius]|uniref:3'-5' exonuclease domain-containing protein n=1 Tax=Corchorus olitorius TaxID=93759 RepID=A0A1R3JZ55_9ROSI|nr:hypothetical protein COLO4_12937 [Corchorus olitorius]